MGEVSGSDLGAILAWVFAGSIEGKGGEVQR
jgi:hypothetical protein